MGPRSDNRGYDAASVGRNAMVLMSFNGSTVR